VANVLVTGGAGFIGSHLTEALLARGDQVLVIDDESTGRFANLASAEKHSALRVVRGSVGDAGLIRSALEGVSEVYHLAGKVSRERDDAREMYKVHVEGTRLLCDAARAVDVKTIVLASTSGTLAVTEDGEIIPDESYPPPLDIVARWPYYASKAYQEMAALERFSGKGLRLVIMNPSLLLGPGDDRLSSTKLVLDFMARKISAVPTGGLSFVDARDAAAAFRAAMKKGRHGERYLLGVANWTFDRFFGRLERLTKVAAPKFALPSKLMVTGSQIVDSLFRQWNFASPVEPVAIEMAQYFWYLNCAKASRELGFRPRDPGETLHDTVTYLRENFLGGDAFGK